MAAKASAPKLAKKELNRPKSSSATNVGQEKGGKKGGKQDASQEALSNASVESFPDENEQKRIIFNHEISALEIRAEDLRGIYEPKPPGERKATPPNATVVVRKIKSPVVASNQKMCSTVVVARPAPPDSMLQVKPFTAEVTGARFDHEGKIIPHSILGDVDEFMTAAVKNGEMSQEMLETFRANPDIPNQVVSNEKKKQKSGYPKFASAAQSHALKNWENKMRQRRRQQCYLSQMLCKPVENLAMNQGDGFRKTQELRYLIDRTIPSIDYGKGYRTGSEFWQQSQLIGGDDLGIHSALTETEKGYPPPILHIGDPKSIRQEKGLICDDPPLAIHKPWHKTPFLRDRVVQLASIMDELDPHEPEMDRLEVVGKGTGYDSGLYHCQGDGWYRCNSEPVDTSNQESNFVAASENEDPLKDYPNVRPVPVFGPSIIFSNQPAKWTGDSHSHRSELGVEARVSFESFTCEKTTSFLEIINDGTTAIYYNWTKVSKPNPFEIVSHNIQRFYFNPGNGVLLPGELLKFPFVFKSPNAGVFTEQWQLHTHPVLCGGAMLLVTLKGIAVIQDTYKLQREEIEHELKQKQTDTVIGDMLNEIFERIQTPERPGSPLGLNITEEQMFLSRNPKFCYSKEKCELLRSLYMELFPEDKRQFTEWDLSIPTIKQKILEMPEEDDRKQEYLQRLNQLLSTMCFSPLRPAETHMYNIGYMKLCEGVERIITKSVQLSYSSGLLDRPPVKEEIVDKAVSEIVISSPSNETVNISVVSATPDSSGKQKQKGKDKKPPAKSKGKEKELTRTVSGAKPTASHSTQSQASQISQSSTVMPDMLSEQPSQTSATPGPPDSVVELKYKEKFYAQAYQTVCDVIDEMDVLFSDVLGRRKLTGSNVNQLANKTRLLDSRVKFFEPLFQSY